MSSTKSLKERIEGYKNSQDLQMLPKLPIAVMVNGKSFNKLTSLLEKPYCQELSECLSSTALRLSSEIEGTVFAYQHNDEILLILRNDQHQDTSPWFDNKVQKICSIASSLATGHFNDCAGTLQLNLTADPLFYCQVFAVPSISEAINTIIYRQQHNFQSSIQFACLYELLKKYDKHVIKEMLLGLSVDAKIELLMQECGVDFSQYSAIFRRGIAYYKIPKIENDIVKMRWFAHDDLPIFTKDQNFLLNILKPNV